MTRHLWVLLVLCAGLLGCDDAMVDAVDGVDDVDGGDAGEDDTETHSEAPPPPKVVGVDVQLPVDTPDDWSPNWVDISFREAPFGAPNQEPTHWGAAYRELAVATGDFKLFTSQPPPGAYWVRIRVCDDPECILGPPPDSYSDFYWFSDDVIQLDQDSNTVYLDTVIPVQP